SSLLKLLHDRFPDGVFHQQMLPPKIDDVILGFPQNPLDLRQGWKKLEGFDFETSTLDDNTIKDGSVLAFRFRHEGEIDRSPLDDSFNVTIPTYEDTYENAPGSQSEV
ncbi:MAG: hypothetical protein M1837_003415, partial [Sclerophora amabilis]